MTYLGKICYFVKIFEERDIDQFSAIELKLKLEIQEDACDWTIFDFPQCLQSFLEMKVLINKFKILAVEINNARMIELLTPIEKSVEDSIKKIKFY